MSDKDLSSEEIAALLQEVKQRVRARYPSTSVPVPSGGPEPIHIPIPDLMPLIHARDAAQAKVASIGSVNPRAGGTVNRAIQRVKRLIARSLAWFVRDQITFNRQILACIEASLQAMAEVNASVSGLAGQMRQQESRFDRLTNEYQELKDVRIHWNAWRVEWEKNLVANEVRYLHALNEIQAADSLRASSIENSLRDFGKAQHADYKNALERSNLEIQDRLWTDLERVRGDFERLIHHELRLVRQRMHRLPALSATAESLPSDSVHHTLDYQRFANRFRGSEEYVRKNQQLYVPIFNGMTDVLDVGCGRGEFLELMRDTGIASRGIDLSEENVAYCRARGLEVERGDLFEYLGRLELESENAIFCGQVVEHIDPMRLPGMIQLCASRLRLGGLLVIETPNPDCLAIFASHFYLDPTHARPVPPSLLSFYMEEAGMGSIKVHPIAPAVDSFPEIGTLPKPFADRFFGSLDYAISGVKL